MSASDLAKSNFIKYLSLILLVFQTTSAVLLLRYSRTVSTKTENGTEAKRYLSSTAVVCGEVLKTLTCVVIIWVQEGNLTWGILQSSIQFWKFKKLGYSFRGTIGQLNNEIVKKPTETLKLLIPAGLYTLQSNLLFIALSRLDAASYQITYQLKILTTALLSILMLGKQLDSTKWISLIILTVGVSLAQVDILNIY